MLQNEKNPEISVIMGVFYRKTDLSLLIRSVNSILTQTFSDFELIICDDGSSEAAAAYLDSVAEQDRRIRLIRPTNCFTLPEKLNLCLRAARGTLIARMDDDDYSHPERFERQVKVLKHTTTEIAFIGSSVNLVQNGKMTGIWEFPEFPRVQDFYLRQPFIHPTLMFRKEALKSVNGYSEAKRCILCEDYDLLLRLYSRGYRGQNLRDPLLDYTLPLKANKKRKMGHRWNEVQTRYVRFKELGLLPRALPYVVKPIVVGLIPEPVLGMIKSRSYNN